MWEDIESNFSIAPVAQMMSIAEDSMFQSRIHEMVHASKSSGLERHGPTKLLDHLYLGSLRDAMNVGKLRHLGITHVFNLAASKDQPGSPYGADSGIKVYRHVCAEDSATYNVMQHFQEVRAFVEEARREGGAALIHCVLGVNRSATLCVAYVMLQRHCDLLSAVHYVQSQRGLVLTNQNFIDQAFSVGPF